MTDPSKVDVEHCKRNTRAIAEDLLRLEKTVRWQGYAIWGLAVAAGLNGLNSIVGRLMNG